MLKLGLVGDRELVLRLKSMPVAIATMIRAKIEALTLKLEARVKQKLSGKVLNVRSGDLRASIFRKVEQVATTIVGAVGSAGVKYARIHEYGGTIKHPGGTKYYIDKATGLARFISNKSELAAWAFPMTRPHDIKIPERSYLRSSLREMAGEIMKGLKEAALDGGRAALKGGVA